MSRGRGEDYPKLPRAWGLGRRWVQCCDVNGEFRAPAVVIATGGLSIPKIGATAFGYEVARQFGLGLVKTAPALVPFVLGGKDRENWCDLAGLSADVIAQAGDAKFRENFLITHRGLSGPAMLQISSYWKPGEAIHIDLAPGRAITDGVQPGSS